MSTAASGTLCQLREFVADSVGSSRFQTWFEGSEFDTHDDCLVVFVKSAFVAAWIANNHMRDLVEATREVLGRSMRVEIRVKPADAPVDDSRSNGAARRAERDRQPARPGLRHSLDTYIVGPCNRLAYAAASQIVESPHRGIRLLVIHGACGVGKTHLLQGLCNAVREQHPDIEWRFISGEGFTNEFITAIRHERNEAFRSRFRTVDLLVIDDIHFLAHKRGTQVEFLHTFDAIDGAGKTVVLSSDRHPQALASLGEPLINRLIAGMVVEIQPPDLATRREFLRRMALHLGKPLPADVLEFVACQIHRSVRDLEGALLRLAAMTTFTREPLTVELARFVLDEQLLRSRRCLTPPDVEQVVADYFGVSRPLLHSRSRDRTVTLARGLAMYLARKHTRASTPEIGRAMGNKNHSTVLMASQRIERLIAAAAAVSWRNESGVHAARIADVIAALDAELARPG